MSGLTLALVTYYIHYEAIEARMFSFEMGTMKPAKQAHITRENDNAEDVALF
jgi:hypothetical protein